MNCKAFDTLYLIDILESSVSNFYSLSNIGTYRMFGIDNRPLIFLENKYGFGAVPEVVEKFIERNIIPNLGKFINFIESVIDL